MAESPRNRFGKYLIERKIAVGGMAEIYRAKTTAGTQVAIKVVHPNLASQQKFIQMFLDEARIATSLHHPNIVQLFDFGKINEKYFISMEWIDGKPLSAVVRKQMRKGIRFPPDVAILLAIDICAGLAYAHVRRDRFDRPLGIVHRDISPPNILITREAVAKVADFGIADAHRKGVHTRPGVIRGKFSYMSPEQSFGEQLDQRSDIFSLGTVIWELLCTRRLFLREKETDTIEAVRRAEVPPIRDRREDVTERLEEIIFKALSPKVSKRYLSADELKDDLEEVLQKQYGGSTRRTTAEFLKVLFPEESFVGIDIPTDELVRRWKGRRLLITEGAIDRPPGSWKAWLILHKWSVSILLAVFCLGVAELLTQFRDQLLALLK